MLTFSLASCGAATTSATYPPPPSFLRPVAVPAVKAGKPMRAIAAEAGAALATANARLAKSRQWYQGIAGGKTCQNGCK